MTISVNLWTTLSTPGWSGGVAKHRRSGLAGRAAGAVSGRFFGASVNRWDL
ncbi:MAG: hypothetical protein KDJ52_35875 [Anaerolineae bacterium]|nr:hypothetical protein [Anaerolineae bacterium]MCB9105544.1 hypothetical protein [Anaerolineales bacterium]